MEQRKGPPNDEQIITERLRNVPRRKWSFADRHEEKMAAAEYAHHKAAIGRVIYDLHPLWKEHPWTPIGELIQLFLPEPDRSIASKMWSDAYEYFRRYGERERSLASGGKE